MSSKWLCLFSDYLQFPVPLIDCENEKYAWADSKCVKNNVTVLQSYYLLKLHIFVFAQNIQSSLREITFSITFLHNNFQ
jgi:hypothetical protein